MDAARVSLAERHALAHYLRGDTLLRRFFEVFLFEKLPASDRRADEVYLDEVDRCTIYLGLFGREYGSEDAAGVSPTEYEFLVTGGGPTEDKPTVVFAPPADPDVVSHVITLRVPDCRGAYETLQARGAEFLTPPVTYEWEIRAFFRDPDGHLLEISETR